MNINVYFFSKAFLTDFRRQVTFVIALRHELCFRYTASYKCRLKHHLSFLSGPALQFTSI